tara:strand:- start:457 stop:1626 length:1170 start_codon:yes stop_codon:yes gene_type:complete
MDDILKEAIADAKALRATALENAKIALEEAFTPRLKNMLSQKIQSEVEGEEDELGEDAYSENEVEDGMSQDDVDVDGEKLAEDEDEMEDADVEEPAGLEAEDGHEMEDADAHDLDGMEAEDGHEMQPEDEVPAELEAEDEEVPAEMEAEDEETVDGDYVGEDEDEDELDLNSVIKELEEELDTSAVGDAENKEPSDDASDSSEIGQGPESEGSDEEGGKENSDDEVIKEPVTEAENGEDKDGLEEIDLEEVMKALSEEEAEDDKEGEVQEMKTQLKEYKDTIGFLREKLNEVTLLNAKLLFTNKLFRGFGLNNNQKLQVVEQFDRTKNLREIKLVYATLAESFKGNGNKRVNESKGQASKAVASTEPKKEVLSEGAEMRNRFKKLANLV